MTLLLCIALYCLCGTWMTVVMKRQFYDEYRPPFMWDASIASTCFFCWPIILMVAIIVYVFELGEMQ